MRVMVGYRGEEIPLKKYNSYYDMDSDLIYFTSNEDMTSCLGLDPEIDCVYVMDNNGNKLPFNFESARAVHAYYTQRRGDEFANWVYLSACGKSFSNKTKLMAYFYDKMQIFTNGEDPSSIKDVQNPEGKRLYDLTARICNTFGIIKSDKAPLRPYRGVVVDNIKQYLKKDNKYDYYYMRKFIIELACYYGYKFDDPIIKIPQMDMDKREETIKNLKKAFAENLNLVRKKNFDNMTRGEEVIVTPLYDWVGDKTDELPFIDNDDDPPRNDGPKKIIL